MTCGVIVLDNSNQLHTVSAGYCVTSKYLTQSKTILPNFIIPWLAPVSHATVTTCRHVISRWVFLLLSLFFLFIFFYFEKQYFLICIIFNSIVLHMIDSPQSLGYIVLVKNKSRYFSFLSTTLSCCWLNACNQKVIRSFEKQILLNYLHSFQMHLVAYDLIFKIVNYNPSRPLEHQSLGNFLSSATWRGDSFYYST